MLGIVDGGVEILPCSGRDVVATIGKADVGLKFVGEVRVLVKSDITRGALQEVARADTCELRQPDAGIPEGISMHREVLQLCLNAFPVDMKSAIS